jgi:CheY-like chemotaxis protein
LPDDKEGYILAKYTLKLSPLAQTFAWRKIISMQTSRDILVVDDEPSILQLCQLILGGEGYRVRIAHGGRQAIRLLEKHTFDVVLLDVMMPDLDGVTVCRHIRAHYASTPYIIMYTADERDLTRDNCLAAGANFVLSKDIPISDLPAKIKKLIDPNNPNF